MKEHGVPGDGANEDRINTASRRRLVPGDERRFVQGVRKEAAAGHVHVHVAGNVPRQLVDAASVSRALSRIRGGRCRQAGRRDAPLIR